MATLPTIRIARHLPQSRTREELLLKLVAVIRQDLQILLVICQTYALHDHLLIKASQKAAGKHTEAHLVIMEAIQQSHIRESPPAAIAATISDWMVLMLQ